MKLRRATCASRASIAMKVLRFMRLDDVELLQRTQRKLCLGPRHYVLVLGTMPRHSALSTVRRTTSLSQASARVMEEQILEARLGDVDILNRDAGVRRGGDDGWNQRAAPVCVQIDLAVGLCRASLGDARQRAERVDERRGRG